jgi:hypothetical protein
MESSGAQYRRLALGAFMNVASHKFVPPLVPGCQNVEVRNFVSMYHSKSRVFFYRAMRSKEDVVAGRLG